MTRAIRSYGGPSLSISWVTWEGVRMIGSSLRLVAPFTSTRPRGLNPTGYICHSMASLKSLRIKTITWLLETWESFTVLIHCCTSPGWISVSVLSPHRGSM